MRVIIAVVGDLGRSPRMQHHALAFARRGHDVLLLGSAGSECDAELRLHPRIATERIPGFEIGPWVRQRAGLYPLAAALALWRRTRAWARAFRGVEGPLDAVLVQTPPILPSLLLAWRLARRHGAQLIFDWHNLGSEVLALQLGGASVWVRLHRGVEGRLARLADRHLAVSRALASRLQRVWGVTPVEVLRDAPEQRFLAARSADTRPLLRRLKQELALELDSPGVVLAVCPTSWSPDEDIDRLINGIELWDQRGAGSYRTAGGVRLHVLISGRGPGRAHTEQRLAARRFSRAAFRTVWVEAEDYPLLLAAAHIGFCLHRSASGLDLPLKLADFRGVGLPALVFDYGETLREVLTPGVEGEVFVSAEQLADRLSGWLDDETARQRLKQRRSRLCAADCESWQQAWERAMPVGREVR